MELLAHEKQGMEEGVTLKEFESAFKLYYASLYRYALSFTREENLAKDVIADVFLQVWVKRNQLKITLSTRSYLFAMVKHQALKHVKAQKAAMQVAGDYFFGLPEVQPSPLEKYLSHESAAFIERLISQLPELRQEILELKLFGLKNWEIAETLGLTEKKVEYQLSQAVAMIRFQIKKSQPKDKLVIETLAFVNIALIFS